MKLVLATKNRGKQAEFQALLSPFRIEVLPMPDGIKVEEDGETYLENAAKKAMAVAKRSGLFALADDSGIEVDALDGAPGVHSARFLNSAGDEDKCAKILELLQGRTQRAARFAISLVLADSRRIYFTAQADVPGQIALQPRGSRGFGYDPIFIPAGHTQTMAELPPAEKNKLSHRARASKALLRYLKYAESDLS